MPPKRKKSVRQKQKQSQRQSVVVNIGKTTTRRRKRTGRGGLPPPSHQQNLFPPTIIQQQANLGNLENEISRLTAFIKERQPVNNLVTPLSSSVNVQQDPAMPGIKAEERRPGPTASNFQSPPSSENFTEDEALAFIRDFEMGKPDPLGGGPSDRSTVSTLSATSRRPGFDDEESVAESFKKEVEKQQLIKTDNPGVKPTPSRSTLVAFTSKFVPITKEQKAELINLQKRASLTPGEETVRNQLTELNKKSILFNKELSVTRVESLLRAPGLYDPSKARGGAVPLSSPFPKPTLSRVETPPGFQDDFFVE